MDLQAVATDPQALATIEAAQIAAGATARAAWIQALAALGAIAAGGLAYFGAVRQVRLQERAHEARAVAYRFRLCKVVEEYLMHIAAACAAAREQLAAYQANGGSARITSFRVVRPRTLHDENWEAHALLGRRAVELILVIDENSLRLAAFDKEIRQDIVRTDSHFESGTLTRVKEGDHGAIAYRPENAMVDYVLVLEGLQQALTALKSELSRPPRRLSWHEMLHRLRGAGSAVGWR
jgi:hypothetical protein